MTFGDAAAPLGLGLAAGLHCAQMCGPVVLAFNLPMSGGRVPGNLAYHVGRAFTYGLLGAIAGVFGHGIALAGTARALSIVAGIALLIAAVWKRGAPDLVQIGGARVAGWLRSPAPWRKAPLGALMGFLPCGLVYAALVKAAETRAAVPGMLTMWIFAAATAVPLLGVGLAAGFAGRKLAPHGAAIARFGMAAAGLFLVWRGVLSPASMESCHVIRG